MKNLVPMGIILIVVLSGLGAGASSNKDTEHLITDTIYFSQPKLIQTDTFCTVELAEATSYLLGPNNPYLPLITQVYYLPWGTSVDSVDVVFSEPQVIHLTSKIRPGRTPQVISQKYSKGETTADYPIADTYPSEPFTYRVGAGLHNGNREIILSVHYSPLRYTPSEDTVLFSERVDITVRYTPPRHPIVFSDAYDLLILAPSEYTAELQTLANHKNSKGISTKLVALEEIPSSGYDIQESIKY